MFTQLLDLLNGLVEVSNQSMGQLHLVGKASNAVMIHRRQHRSFNSLTCSTQEVVVLGMLHLIILLMS
jgi:hypothetical protein